MTAVDRWRTSPERYSKSGFNSERSMDQKFPKVVGTTNLYGYAIGILMIEGYFPRLPGAIGNATTFPFPVLHYPVKGATGPVTTRALADLSPESEEFRNVIEPWLEGARALERMGVKAITTSCGFSAIFQKQLTEAVSIPVFATSLLLVPFIAQTISRDKLVGIVVADARSITASHLSGAGVDPKRIVFEGMEASPHFEEMSFEGRHDIDFSIINDEVSAVAKKLMTKQPKIGALLLECSLLGPFASSLQKDLGIPVFDYPQMVTLMHGAICRMPYGGPG
jgi:hypothetical protein